MVNKQDEQLDKLRKHADDTLRLWSNAQKPERERMVCRAFLRCLGVPFSEEELRIDSGEPVDVSFLSAQFQITEVLDKGRKRTDEWRDRKRRYQDARSLTDLVEPVTSPDNPSLCPISYREILGFLLERLSQKAQRYGGANCAKLDVLVCVGLKGRYLWPLDITLQLREVRELQMQRWRSVSMLFIPYSVVVFAREGAPEFLQTVQGQVLRKWPRPDGWFDR